jgi:predicted nucleotidyltransferase
MPYPADIENKLREVDEICAKYCVQELSLFGSALHNDFGSRSDLDFLVEFRPGTRVGLFHLIRLQHELEDLFERKGTGRS